MGRLILSVFVLVLLPVYGLLAEEFKTIEVPNRNSALDSKPIKIVEGEAIFVPNKSAVEERLRSALQRSPIVGSGSAQTKRMGKAIRENLTNEAADALNATEIREIASDGEMTLFKVKDSDTPLRTSAVVNADGDVVGFVEPNILVELAGSPNDPEYVAKKQWGIESRNQLPQIDRDNADIDVEDAWQFTMGDPNVVVAVIDTGIDYNHPDLIERMWKNPGEVPGDNIDNDRNGIVDDVYGANLTPRGSAPNTGDPMDNDTQRSHGTAVAGIIAASANNIGGVGIAPRAKLFAIKGFNVNVSDIASIYESIDYLISIKRANPVVRFILNGSFFFNIDPMLCMPYCAPAPGMQYFMNLLNEEGIFSAFAAGDSNDNMDIYTSLISFPVNYSNEGSLKVTAHDSKGRRSRYANWGFNLVDLSAPGEQIFSTHISGRYGFSTGSSFATAMASGVAALLLSQDQTLSPKRIKEIIIASSERADKLRGLTASSGMLSAGNALRYLRGDSVVTEIPSLVYKLKIGAQANLKCDGNGAIQWYKDGNAISGARGKELLASSEGLYRCQVTKTGRSPTQSSDFYLDFSAFGNSYLSADTLRSSGAQKGETVAFVAPVLNSSSAIGPFTYTWYKDGEVIPNSNTPTIFFPNSNLLFSGSEMMVKISDGRNEILSNTARVYMGDRRGADILMPPQDIYATEGDRFATYRVRVTGPGPTYWADFIVGKPETGFSVKRGFYDMSTEGRYMEFTHVLTDPKVSDDRTKAKAIVYSWSGMQETDWATLYVQPRTQSCEDVQITREPADQAVDIGARLSLSVEARGGADSLRYQWRKDGENISGATEATYSKVPVSLLDIGRYSAVVEGGCGTSVVQSREAIVTVRNGPQSDDPSYCPDITWQKELPSVTKSRKAVSKLKVKALGEDLSYLWYVDGKNAYTTRENITIRSQPRRVRNVVVYAKNQCGKEIVSKGVIRFLRR